MWVIEKSRVGKGLESNKTGWDERWNFKYGPIEKVAFEQNTYRGEGINLWLLRKGFIDLNFKIF